MRSWLEAQEPLGYWPRLIVTGPVGERAWKELDTASAKTRIADRLKFVYLSQRARAEAVALQRQPGLVEQIVRLSIGDANQQEALSRTLFQLLVPLEFKETARQMDALVLVVDAYTANFPWELMVADKAPMIKRPASCASLKP